MPPSHYIAAHWLARVPQNVLMKMSKLPNPAQPPTIIQADELARAPQAEKRAHENEQAAPSCPTSRHYTGSLASPGATDVLMKMSKLPNPAQPPTIT